MIPIVAKPDFPANTSRDSIYMANKKGMLQKISLVAALLSLVLAVVSGIFLYFRLAGTGSDNPLSASLMASTFFFLCVGAVFAVMGHANLPSFKLDASERE